MPDASSNPDAAQTLEHIDLVREHDLGWHRHGFERLGWKYPLATLGGFLVALPAKREEGQAVLSRIDGWHKNIFGIPERELASNLIVDVILNANSLRKYCGELAQKSAAEKPAQTDQKRLRLVQLYQAEQLRNDVFVGESKTPVLLMMSSIWQANLPEKAQKQKLLIMQKLATLPIEQDEFSQAQSDLFFILLQAKSTDKEETVRRRVIDNLAALYREMGLTRYAHPATVRSALLFTEETLEPVRHSLNKVVYNAIGVPPKIPSPIKSYVVARWGQALKEDDLINLVGVEVVMASRPAVGPLLGEPESLGKPIK